MPKGNKKNVHADLAQSVKDQVEFVYVSNIDEALEEVFGRDIWREGNGAKVEARL